jgi:hypothetical protein
MRVRQFRLSTEYLEQLLRLPPRMHIARIETLAFGVVRVVVEHPDFPELTLLPQRSPTHRLRPEPPELKVLLERR